MIPHIIVQLQGAALYDLLGREVELREKRQTVLARTLEIQEVALASILMVMVVLVMILMLMVLVMILMLMVMVMDHDGVNGNSG